MTTYGQVVEGLLLQGEQPRFETPRHLVSIICPFHVVSLSFGAHLLIPADATSNVPDLWLVVASPEDDARMLAEILEIPSQAKVIVLVTKM